MSPREVLSVEEEQKKLQAIADRNDDLSSERVSGPGWLEYRDEMRFYRKVSAALFPAAACLICLAAAIEFLRGEASVYATLANGEVILLLFK